VVLFEPSHVWLRSYIVNGAGAQAPRIRSIESIDAELRLLSRAWAVAREFGCSPSTAQIDALLDERLAANTRSLQGADSGCHARRFGLKRGERSRSTP